MSTRTEIEDAAIAWLVAAGVAGGIPSPDNKVILADDDGVRPALPYLTVRLPLHDVPVGEDQDLYDDEATPNWRAHGYRRGTLTVNGYGDGAEAWIVRATQHLRAPAIRNQLIAAGLAITALGGLRNLSGLVDDATENRFGRDFEITYQLESDTVPVIELESAAISETYESDAPTGDRSTSFTVTL